MTIRRPIHILVPALVLTALAACADVPLAPHGDPDALLGKSKFERTKPHVNVDAPAQPVLVQIDEGAEVRGRFQARLRVHEDGRATGEARLGHAVDDASACCPIVFYLGFSRAVAREVEGSMEVAFAGEAEVCTGGRCDTTPVRGSVVEARGGDDARWRFEGPGIAGMSLGARTRFVRVGREDAAAARGFFPEQEVETREPGRGGGTRLFRAEFSVRADGTASGDLALHDVTDPRAPALHFEVHKGRFAVGPDGVVQVHLGGVMEERIEGRVERREAFSATVRQSPNEDSHIWQFHSGNVYSGSFEATGDLAPLPPSGWHPIGAGMSSWVAALAVYGGNLVAGGDFTEAGGEPAQQIARWDGSAWHPVGGGMNASVHALAVYDGDLIAGGFFSEAGGVSAQRIARWNGSDWSSIGGGMDFAVFALTVYDGDLIAAGGFTEADGQPANRIARWDGSQWHPLGDGMSGFVQALAVHDGDLIAAGHFSEAGGQPANSVARWDGSAWHPLGAGVSGLEAVVWALTVHDGDLIAGGHFNEAGGAPTQNIARWDGSAWHSLGEGVGDGWVHGLTVHAGNLVAGGPFTEAGGESVGRIARWDGSSWHPIGVGMDDAVLTVGTYGSDLVAGGMFNEADSQSVRHIARWGAP